jgi:hypothetical protein
MKSGMYSAISIKSAHGNSSKLLFIGSKHWKLPSAIKNSYNNKSLLQSVLITITIIIMPVQNGDILEIPSADTWVKMTIKWSQDWGKEYEKNYYRVEFKNTRCTLRRCLQISSVYNAELLQLRDWQLLAGEPETQNLLFIAEEKVDALKTSKAQKTDSGFKVTVDKDFRYGQQKGEKNRFLVFHDNTRNIYQVNTPSQSFVMKLTDAW